MNGRSRIWIALAALALAGWGCVEIDQEIHVNHDGSGKIVEKIALSPRGERLMEAAGREEGKADLVSELFGEESFQARLKAMGEVTVESRTETKLPDGRRQLQNVYAFKDLNKVRLWTVPTLDYKRKLGMQLRFPADGQLRLKYQPEYEAWGKCYRETVTVEAPRLDGLKQGLVSPAERQKFIRVLPVFADMVQDLRLSIVLVAPIEEFEEPQDMLINLTAEGNRVALFKVDGRALAESPEGLLQLVMDEVVDPGAVRDTPGIFMPWPVEHGGRVVRFMKATPTGARP